MFAHPSLHESSIVNLRLLRGLIKFMQKVGVSIINFARWREQKYQIYQGARCETHELEQTLSAITDKNKQLKAEEQEKKMQLLQKVDAIQALEMKIVRSPTRNKNELKQLSGNIQRDKLEITQSKQWLHYDQRKLTLLGQLHTRWC